MTKIVINKCYGGFGLSEAAYRRYAELAGGKVVEQVNTLGMIFHKLQIGDGELTADYDLRRDDPHLVQTVEELGGCANASHATLKVVEIPDDVEWQVDEYDGFEHIAENHRTWG